MRGLLLSLGLFLATPAFAQNPFASDVTYSAVDRATVRVFAVREVGIQNVMGHRVLRTVAIPDAGHGSGIVVDPRGVVVTAAHVVQGARHIAVRLSSGELHLARVVRMDEALDYAILVLGAGGELPHLPLPDEPPVIAVRSTVDAIGYPLDADREQPQSSRGIISAAMNDGRLQLSISLNPGNSGGPLIDENEALIGIVVARGDPEAGVQGIGVAVPMRPILAAYQAALTEGAVAAAYDALQTIPDRSARASVVDAVVRLGGVEVLRETAQAVDAGMQPERLARFHGLGQSMTDPDLLAMLSGYFWDAALIALERGGGYATPDSMPEGAARDTAATNWNRAVAYARKAAQADANLVQRSPFIAYLAGQFDLQVAPATGGYATSVAQASAGPSISANTSAAQSGRFRLTFGPTIGAGGRWKVDTDFGDVSAKLHIKAIGALVSAQWTLTRGLYVGAAFGFMRYKPDLRNADRDTLFGLDLLFGVRKAFELGATAIEPFAALGVGLAAGMDADDGSGAVGVGLGVDVGATFWLASSFGLYAAFGWRMQQLFASIGDIRINQGRAQLGFALRFGTS